MHCPKAPFLSSLLRNRRRLLHPGADTKLILTQYVSIIRCLRIIDPQGVLLFKVADPIRRYLRSAVYSHPISISCNPLVIIETDRTRYDA